MTDSRRKFFIGKYSQGEADNTYRPLVSGDGARPYYRHGYYHAAMDIIAGLLSGHGTLESAMPALFLGRHYIELAMKDMLSKKMTLLVTYKEK